MATKHHSVSTFWGESNFAGPRMKAILVVTLLLTWTIANVLPAYQPVLKSTVHSTLKSAHSHLPSIHINWSPSTDPRSQFNSSKLALMIENRPLPHLVPQLLHMISVVPPDWRFMVIGSNKSVLSMDRSFATRYHQANGKLDLLILPEPWSIKEKEDVYRLLTDMRFFDQYLEGVEWLLKFEADSMLCANSLDSLDDWLEYDWAGAPRHVGDRFAGNGGLTLRRMSMMKTILGFQNRVNHTLPEDEWYGRRLTHIPGIFPKT